MTPVGALADGGKLPATVMATHPERHGRPGRVRRRGCHTVRPVGFGRRYAAIVPTSRNTSSASITPAARVVRASVLLGSVAALAASYCRWVRPWQLTWGSTAAEVARAMPGDDVVDRPSFIATRAVTVAAPPENIYPWLVQMGVGRAGWYSYDLLDNLGRRSAERLDRRRLRQVRRPLGGGRRSRRQQHQSIQKYRGHCCGNRQR